MSATTAPARVAGFISFHAGEAVATGRYSSEAIATAIEILAETDIQFDTLRAVPASFAALEEIRFDATRGNQLREIDGVLYARHEVEAEDESEAPAPTSRSGSVTTTTPRAVWPIAGYIAFTDSSIYGTGVTAEAAMDNAIEACEDLDRDQLRTLPASADLFYEAEHGSPRGWTTATGPGVEIAVTRRDIADVRRAGR